MTPVHEHDCNRCRFLGSLATFEGTFDLYHCAITDEVLARHGAGMSFRSCAIADVAFRYGRANFDSATALITAARLAQDHPGI